jgi:hypothetical protein
MIFFHIYPAKTEILFTPLKTPISGGGKLIGGGDYCYPYPSVNKAAII